MEHIAPKKQKDWRVHLGGKYNTVERFISYAYQLQAIEGCAPNSVLEVGPGSTIISHHLRSMGYQVATADVDKDAKPDVLGDIRSLPVEDNTYDAVLAFQVLEHVPWEDFGRALKELARVSKKHLIISLPERSTYFEIVIKLPLIRSIFNRPFFDMWLAIPVRFPKGVSKQHHWETDFWQYSRRDIRKKLREVGTIQSEFSPVLNKYHRFYIIEKEKDT